MERKQVNEAKKRLKMDADYILAINPGATSTKIAVYRTNKFVFLKTIRHECDDLSKYKKTYRSAGYEDETGAERGKGKPHSL